jgi:uncharacterized membrane protein YbhN (UPF0104 family)
VLFVSYPGAGVTLAAVAGSLLTLAGVMWLSLSRRWRPVTRLVRILVRLRIFAQFFLRLCRRARRMEDQVSRVFCEEGKAARVGFLLLMASHVVIFTRPAVFFLLGARIPLGPAKLCLIFVVSQALLAFQLTPSGVGTLDGGLIGAFALVGLPRAEAQAMAYLLCLRFWDAIIIGTGAFIAARAGAGFLTQKAEAAKEMHLVEEPAEDGCADPQDD